MKKFAGVLAGLLVPGFIVAAVIATPAIAQDKARMEKSAPKVVIKVITENDKVRVYEAKYAPGAENTAVASSSVRVVRALKAGKLERRYADGKRETVVWKVGKVEYIPSSGAYTTKNIGKTEILLYVVQLK